MTFDQVHQASGSQVITTQGFVLAKPLASIPTSLPTFAGLWPAVGLVKLLCLPVSDQTDPSLHASKGLMGPSADRSNPTGIKVLIGIQMGGRRLEFMVRPLGDKDYGFIECKLGFIILLASMGRSAYPFPFSISGFVCELKQTLSWYE